jgi:hypothetical protein
MHFYRLNTHHSRAQLPDIDSRRNGWLMEIPAPFDPVHLNTNELVTSAEKFPIA